MVPQREYALHSIVTSCREAFYWLAILFTFALGTATGDLMAEVLGLGYVVTGVIVAAVIAITAAGWRFGLNSVLAFWMIYILTRPLGASIGDYLSQSPSQGGLGLGATLTSLIFVVGILVLVTYLSVTKADVIRGAATHKIEPEERGGLWQTAAVLALVLVAAGTGYSLRKSALQEDGSDPVVATQTLPGGAHAAPLSPLGRSLGVPEDHPRHPRPAERRQPIRRHHPGHRPRDSLGQRRGPPQAEGQARLDQHRRQDRHRAARAPLDKSETGQRMGRAHRAVGRPHVSRFVFVVAISSRLIRYRLAA